VSGMTMMQRAARTIAEAETTIAAARRLAAAAAGITGRRAELLDAVARWVADRQPTAR
jgi:hypothetical protein